MSVVEDNRNLLIRVEEAVARVRAELQWESQQPKPEVALVLGSGLGAWADALKDRVVLPYKRVPHMKESAVPGHAGQWVCGTTRTKKRVLVAQGRVHYYEGYDWATVTLHIRIMQGLGIKHVVLTNAAGSVNPGFHPGNFMLLDDHINLTGSSPLRGIVDERLGKRFVDMSEPYCRRTNEALMARAKRSSTPMNLHRGVYIALQGPNYETPAEIRMLHRLGGDAVGMSTAAETIVARQCSMKVTGISCITNYGSGITGNTLSHEEVAAVGKAAAPKFGWLLDELCTLV